MTLTKKKFIDNLKNYTFENKPVVAAAVSGGPDSMALVFLLNNWIMSKNGKLIALIVDHKIRNNSALESKEVLSFLNKNKINTKILTVRKSKVKKKNMSEARNNRYSLLTKYCKKNNILHLFLGHHEDDNLETFLNRKLTGSDFEGLNSISKNIVINGTNIIRPLLQTSKKNIYYFNKKNNIFFVEDSSNYNFNYLRPIIRNYLKNIKGNLKKQIISDFELVKKYSSSYRFMISEIFLNLLISVNSNKLIIKNSSFKKLDNLIAEQIIKKIYKFFFGFNSGLRTIKIQKLIVNIQNEKVNFYNIKGLIAKKNGNYLIFSQKTL